MSRPPRPPTGRRRARRAPPLAGLRRRPVAWWAVTVVLAAVTAQVVSGAVARAERGAARFGDARSVLVLRVDVAAGALVTAADAEVRELPAALVPEFSVGPEALGSRARAPLFAGEVVHPDRLVPSGLSPVAARLPEGTRGVGVQRGPDTPPVEVGDVVDVLATVTGPADAPTTGPPTVTVAAGAVVVAVDEGAVTLAVPLVDTPRVAYASAAGIVTLALVGG